jgi:HTH-type transcriptional regulator/antitoxin HigA
MVEIKVSVEFKVIKSEAQHNAYLSEVESLILENPPQGSVKADHLDLLTVLIETYENQKFPVEAPDPIDAILFRMQEQGLKQVDLIHYFGTRSRVSEVLSRKRPLTVPMIRALSIGLGISADTLVGLSVHKNEYKTEEIDWSRFPIKEIVSRGWIDKFTNNAASATEDIVKSFISDVGLQFGGLSFRRTINGEAYSPSTKYALYAWIARVIQRAREKSGNLGVFDENVFSTTFMRDLAQLSWFENGPLLAIEFLEKHGIAVVIESHLKGTSLDGAALKDNGFGIIGLTLRSDRLDNFWFTLLHEVAHLWKHVTESDMFLDDFDASSEDRREIEANRIAREAFIPRIVWKRSEAYKNPSKESIDQLSRELKIHPSIIAGRIRKEFNNYKLFTDIVGYGEVKHLFNDVTK